MLKFPVTSRVYGIFQGAKVESVRMSAPGTRDVISGGWRLESAYTPDVFSTKTFPLKDNVWAIVIWNEITTERTITPCLITKR